jgi:hypothetical protein
MVMMMTVCRKFLASIRKRKPCVDPLYENQGGIVTIWSVFQPNVHALLHFGLTRYVRHAGQYQNKSGALATSDMALATLTIS